MDWPWRLPVVLVVLFVVAGCGGGGQHDATAPSRGKAGRPPASPTVLEGRLVPIGGGRSLYIHCLGAGSPTILLEAGYGQSADTWRDVQARLARVTRTCAYDRAGLGNSLPMPGVHDATDEVADLGRLLSAAHVPPPYVLVGHSYGGLLVRLFAHAHPSETAGVVLVDALGRNALRRELALWPKSHIPAQRRRYAKPVADGIDLPAGQAADAKVRSLGHIPLVVVSAGRENADMATFSPRLRRAEQRLWPTMQNELARLSTDHVHVVALRSSHFIQRLDGQPQVVIRAAEAAVRAARTQSHLLSCKQLFTGQGVRCRS